MLGLTYSMTLVFAAMPFLHVRFNKRPFGDDIDDDDTAALTRIAFADLPIKLVHVCIYTDAAAAALRLELS